LLQDHASTQSTKEARMSDPIEELTLRLGRRSAVRLAWVATITAVLWSIGANLLQEGAKPLLTMLWACSRGTCDATVPTDAAWTLGSGLVLAITGLIVALEWGIPAVRGAFLNSVAVVRRNDRSKPSAALIATLSDLRYPEEKVLADQALERAVAAGEAERARLLDELCDPHGLWKGWRWQQPLRLLRHNLVGLEVVSFVLTAEAAPQYLSHFRPLLERLGPHLVILPAPDGAQDAPPHVDHSAYNAVTAALDRACAEVMAAKRCAPADICIDITSGTKAWSAAATVKTLNSAAVFSYVETEAPYDVVIYDASLTT
jgi:hypothetical protein